MPSGLLTADSPGLGAAFGPAQWGIFGQDGSPLLTVDSVAEVEYSRDYRISDYPQEKGAFASYNKVKTPFRAKIGFYIAQSRVAFLNSIEAAVASLDLVTVATPEISYASANLTHYGYRRQVQSGVTLILVEVECEEIRIIAGAQPAAAQSTNAATPTQSGDVQPTATVQKPPAAAAESAPGAGDGTVGGPFTPTTGGVAGTDIPIQNTIPLDTSPIRTPGQGTLDILSDRNTPEIPAGIPNSTGGGASALSTPLNDVIIPSTVGGF